MIARLNGRVLAVAVAVVLLAATFFTFVGGGETRTVTAHFSRAVSIYPGSQVRILGVPVGKVTAVIPEGDSVRVDMEYDPQYKVPADAQAVVITPTLVADRFVQLTPAYTSGPTMKDGGDIPVRETGAPVELDRIYASLADLTVALGPNGANKNGALDDLLASGANALDGQGARGNAMLMNLSRAAETFGRGSGDLFGTVKELATFTETLAANDRVVSGFIRDLAGVSSQLDGERQELRAALVALADAVGTVRTFVHDNRHALTGNVRRLGEVLGTIAKERDNLGTALGKGALGLDNLRLAYDVPTGSIGSRISFEGQRRDVDGFLCTIVKNAHLPSADQACAVFRRLIQPVTDQAASGGGPSLPGGTSGARLGSGAPAQSLSDLLGGGSA